MRLSDYDTDKAMEILCLISSDVGEIVSDEKFVSKLKEAREKYKAEDLKSNNEVVAAGLSMISSLIPYLLGEKREAVLDIIAEINGKDIEEIKKQRFPETLKQASDIFKDKELFGFFG